MYVATPAGQGKQTELESVDIHQEPQRLWRCLEFTLVFSDNAYVWIIANEKSVVSCVLVGRNYL